VFSIKGSLGFMKNLHHKVVVAFACTALSCTLGANEEAKAAKFTLTPTPFFIDGETNGSGYRVFDSEYDATPNIFSVQRTTVDDERRAFYEFNISNFSLDTDTAISRAILVFLFGY
jgi:hypothetical protein